MLVWKRDLQWCTLAALLLAVCTSNVSDCATPPPVAQGRKLSCLRHHISRRALLSHLDSKLIQSNLARQHDGSAVRPPLPLMLQAYCDNKKGLLAPGLEDVITVEFCPTEWRYYYDCLRIHSQVSSWHIL